MPAVTGQRLIAGGMLREGTPIQDYRAKYGLHVKREDLSCPQPGPQFSKTRGVWAHVKARPEELIGVLDTFHSQAGHAVARACSILGKQCLNFYPIYAKDAGQPLRAPQARSSALGATLRGLPAGRSCILFHQAKKHVEASGGYMMPNALKLDESVAETAKEVGRSRILGFKWVIVPASSGTIAAGVIRGFCERLERSRWPSFLIHLGYSRSTDTVRRYITSTAGFEPDLELVDEGYAYKDQAVAGVTPPWPCNEYYDMKAFRWFLANRGGRDWGTALFWNIG